MLPPPDSVHRFRRQVGERPHDRAMGAVKEPHRAVDPLPFRCASRREVHCEYFASVLLQVRGLHRYVEPAERLSLVVSDEVTNAEAHVLRGRQRASRCQRRPCAKHSLGLAAVLPYSRRLNVVYVSHFALVWLDRAQLFSRHKGVESPELFEEHLSHRIVMRVLSGVLNLPPIVDEPIGLELNQPVAALVDEEAAW